MAAKADLDIYQGDDYAAIVSVQNADGSPADISGYTAQAQIRSDVADNSPLILATMSAVVSSPNISLALGHTATAALAGGKFRWDLQIVSASGVITTILAGAVTVKQEVTRP